MFKKFLVMFAFCMSIFGITAFADTVDPLALAPDGTEYKYYYKITNYKDTGDYCFVYSNEEINFDVSSSAIRFTSKGPALLCFYNSKGELTSTRVATGARVITVSSGFVPVITQNGSVLPPVIAPTAQQAIAKIVPGLSTQLKVLLPVGVILLSTMLGVSLVPRLVRLFL